MQSSFRSEGLSILRPLPPETEGKEIYKENIKLRNESRKNMRHLI